MLHAVGFGARACQHPGALESLVLCNTVRCTLQSTQLEWLHQIAMHKLATIYNSEVDMPESPTWVSCACQYQRLHAEIYQ